ncbi:MAG: ATP-dependent DNA helicase [Alphaproteobacteria bacterium]|nr:ATP-dependent DNA helicase [Alphaproteobacteria bacterium]
MTLPKLYGIAGNQFGFISIDHAGNCLKAKDACALMNRMQAGQPVVVNRALSGVGDALEVLELFALAHPVARITPNIAGLSRFFNLPPPVNTKEKAAAAMKIADILLNSLDERALSIAGWMAQRGWPWGRFIPGIDQAKPAVLPIIDLPVWEEAPPRGQAGTKPISGEAAAAALQKLLSRKQSAQPRQQQVEYAAAIAAALSCKPDDGTAVVLAQAGTGVGKTLGYLAPLSLWVQENQGQAWISTYTKALQNQLLDEAAALDGDLKIAVKKGRENYICLLNIEDLWNSASKQSPKRVLAAGLASAWLAHTKSGDLMSGDWQSWLNDIVGANIIAGLTDHPGECIFAACPHFSRCFIERNFRLAAAADIVITNHTLAMMDAASGAPLPPKIVFDEGHLLFKAADSVWTACVSYQSGVQLRYQLLGVENNSGRFRLRGIKRRLQDVAAVDNDVFKALNDVVHYGQALPQSGGLLRVINGDGPMGEFEEFLSATFAAVKAANPDDDGLYTIERDTLNLPDSLLDKADALRAKLAKLSRAARQLAVALTGFLDNDDLAAKIHPSEKVKAQSALKHIGARVCPTLETWTQMLSALCLSAQTHNLIYSLKIPREQGRVLDAGFFSNFIDPMLPFCESLDGLTQTVAITSASLTDPVTGWDSAMYLTGGRHFCNQAAAVKLSSPFDYAKMARVLIVNDVDKKDSGQVSAAISLLFNASGGGAIGLFTAITRLKSVYKQLGPWLERDGVDLYAQHVQDVSLSTLLDIFKAEEDSCLLGTDSLRDGIDVPGRSLRLLVFDRSPWSKPDLLHKARRKDFGDPDLYDKIMLRARLTQAFGRLIRTSQDRGVFVILDRAVPTIALSAFPEGVIIDRLPINQACLVVKQHLDGLDHADENP